MDYRRKFRKMRQLKKRPLWPHILGMLFVLAIYLFVNLAVVEMVLQTNLIGKSDAVLQSFNSVEELLDNIEDESVLNERLFEMTKYSENMVALQVTQNEKTVYSFGAMPDDSHAVLVIEDFSERQLSAVEVMNQKGEKIQENDYKKQYARIFGSVIGSLLETVKNDDLAEKVVNGKVSFLDVVFLGTEQYNGYTISCSHREKIGLADVIGIMALAFVELLLAVLLFIYFMCLAIGTVRDRRKFYFALYTDRITGGYNQLYYQKTADRRIRKMKKNKNGDYYVAVMRLEKYRGYVLSNGVKKGEEYLAKVLMAIHKKMNKHELAVRYEKSDYALLFISDTKENAQARVKEIAEAVNNSVKENETVFSIGICKVNDSKEKSSVLFNEANLARGAVDLSVDNIEWFNEKMREEKLWEVKVEEDKEVALAEHQYVMYLQPKYSAKEEKLSAAEALVRWNHPMEGLISPGRFIPIFEKDGFILKLDDYMIEELAKTQAKWIAQGKSPVPISVNVSRAHFTDTNLAEHIAEIVDRYGVPHDCIELEVTESAFFDDKSQLTEIVKKMKALGFAVSMDDFGSGFSSLNSLKELPLDVVKLDAEFFRGEDELNRGNIVVEETISLAKKLDMRIVAEGIETRDQVDFLADKECDLIQGFYFAKPMPVDEFEKKAYENCP